MPACYYRRDVSETSNMSPEVEEIFPRRLIYIHFVTLLGCEGTLHIWRRFPEMLQAN